jgi:hypothetical protein
MFFFLTRWWTSGFRILLFWGGHCQWVIGSRCFEVTYCLRLQVSNCPKRMAWTFRAVKMMLLYVRTSGCDSHPVTQHHVLQEGSPELHRCRNVKQLPKLIRKLMQSVNSVRLFRNYPTLCNCLFVCVWFFDWLVGRWLVSYRPFVTYILPLNPLRTQQ